jgi:acetyl-CoA C-acetyltransferase
VIDPRTPVIVGAGQVSQRVDPAGALEPVDLLAHAARLAADDAGPAGATLLPRADTVAVVDMLSWRYSDPGALLGRRLGFEPASTVTTTVGGNSPQMLVNRLAADVQAGRRDTVLLGGAECVHTRWRARRAEPKVWLGWTETDDPACDTVLGDTRPGSSPYEMAHLAVAPTQVYPLFETALRASAGETVEDHQIRVSELWSTFAAVAAANPHAWSQTAFTAEEIRTVSAENRLVCFPYPKRMCANIDVDQAAALLLCSYGTARAAGVADDRMVFPLSGADAHDHFFFTERDTLSDSPAIAAAARDALGAAGVALDEVARFDLYSCFPSAVQIAMRALGLRGPAGGDGRPLTVTGGLGFAGGPGNDYVTHSIASMVAACREDPDSVGLVTALGWYVTKHAVGLYSTRPPEQGFRAVDPSETQRGVDRRPRREPAGAYSGDAIVEATSVGFERDGTPNVAVVCALTPDGRRALANSRDADALRSMTREAWEGRTVRIAADGDANRLES